MCYGDSAVFSLFKFRIKNLPIQQLEFLIPALCPHPPLTSVCVTKNPVGDFSGTKRAARDQLTMQKSNEKLCLQWKDFQGNLTSAFRDLRDDKEFTDVTLASEDGQQLEAHKVVLISSSPFFRHLLQRNKHPHPLIYMRGVKSKDLVTITQLLYQGEANVYQENLDSFLAIAEELQLKGLYGNQTEAVPKENLPPESYYARTSLSEEGVYSVDESHKLNPSIRKPTRGRPNKNHSRDGKRKAKCEQKKAAHSQTKEEIRRAKREQKKVARIEREREKLDERRESEQKKVARIEKEREKSDERQARKVKARENAKERAWRSELFSRGLATDDQVMFLSVSFMCWSL